MTDVLLTLIMAKNVAQHVEDLLLQHADLVNGFTTSVANGHGSHVSLVEATELVSGHSPRTCIHITGSEECMRKVLAQIRQDLPRVRVFYWLQPVLETGHL